MDELIQHQVTVDTGTGAVPRFVIREPRRLCVGDRIEWRSRSYRVVAVRFDPDRPHQAVATVERT
jgi:hypothetical protein